MGKYVVRDNIPILDTHELRDEKGNLIQKVTDADLYRICENNNRRIRETGDYCPVVIGHTKDGLPEHLQPEIVGHAYKFRVGPLFKTGRKAIIVTMRFFRNKYDKARNFPRRSVELWPGRKEIDPISLLGATAPERDLGLMQYSKSGRVIRYSRISPNEETMNPTPNTTAKSPEDELVEKVLARIFESDAWKKLEAMAGEGEEGAPAEGAPEAQPEVGMAPEGPVADAEPDEGHEGAEPDGDEDLFEEQPQKYEAGAPAAPSGSNTYVPVMGKDKKPATKMSRNPELERYAREHEELRARLHDVTLKLSRTSREKDLIELENQGYQFDRNEELDEVQGMDDATYQKRLEKIKKRYSRSPVMVRGDRRDNPIQHSRSAGAGSPRSKDEVDRIVKYATSKGIDYATAAAEFDGVKVR